MLRLNPPAVTNDTAYPMFFVIIGLIYLWSFTLFLNMYAVLRKIGMDFICR